MRGLFGRLALQNLARRPGRTLLLALAVAVASAALFASAALLGGLQASMARGFSRLGADLLVLPARTLAHVKAALLVVEPTAETLDPAVVERIARLPGVLRAAPQRVWPGSEEHDHGASRRPDVIGFDPARDFTVQPWIAERLPREMQPGDALVGAAHPAALGAPVTVNGRSATVYARLGRTGVGTHEQAVYVPDLEGVVSGVLVQLAPGASPEAVRFALAADPSLKVVSGGTLVVSVRQSLVALLGGLAGLAVLMLLVTALMVGVVYSAVVGERRRELGLLLAIGARPGQLVGLILAEAALATGLGGLAGVALGAALLRVGQRTLLFHLEQAGVPFQWPSLAEPGAACLGLAVLVGLLGAFWPAWRMARLEPYDLVRAE